MPPQQARAELRTGRRRNGSEREQDTRHHCHPRFIHADLLDKQRQHRAKASIDGKILRLEPTSVKGLGVPLRDFAVTYEIPGAELLPCAATGRAVPDGLLVTCTVADVPPSLVRSVQ